MKEGQRWSARPPAYFDNVTFIRIVSDSLSDAQSPRPRGRIRQYLSAKHALGDEGCEPQIKCDIVKLLT